MTREEFVKQRCKINKITEAEFEKTYRVVDCNCGAPYCKGYRCLDLDGLLKENQELKEQLDKYENPKDMTLMMMWSTEKVKDENKKLKKQLEEWEHHLKCSKEMLDIQGQKGNYDYDEYMLGLYNGMEYIIALFETREPNYISGKDVKFTSNKIQQKEFIKYLEDEINALNVVNSTPCGLSFENERTRKVYQEILQKYKGIMGGNKNESN